ncbi:MAG: D-alanyl-D-alanine carboxypeptidase family protein, partial [Flavobacteriales bacterium]
MKRRSFIKKSGVAGFTISIWPHLALPSQVEYSVMELMGKADIELYGKDINLRMEAHDAFVAMKKAAAVDGIDIKV